MKVVVTGFEPFGEHAENPSRLIVRRLGAEGVAGFDLVTAELPTVFAAAGAEIRRLLDAHRPDLLLSIGVASNRSVISVERIGLNLDDTALPDNAGFATEARPIVTSGPLALAATLPVLAMRAAIGRLGLPVEVSNHAGTYVCNHVLYAALHHAAAKGHATRIGFLHVPQVIDPTAKSNLGLDDLVAAARAALQAAAGAGA
ncbi:pyroglutamyl-peptidase I [Desertibaculum subflavum]|uniref:pyroglutamyl-peptidase I family protein n=1 Tax=Desertibaculum subflavum TaxID=2268458 RepID=UPI000E66AE75